MKNSRVETRELLGTIESCRSPTAAQRVWLIRSVVLCFFLFSFGHICATGRVLVFQTWEGNLKMLLLDRACYPMHQSSNCIKLPGRRCRVLKELN